MSQRKRPSQAQRSALLTTPLFGVGKTAPVVTPLTTPADPLEPTPLFVPLKDIRPYEHNPRRAANQKYQEIKLSIRQQGFTGTLCITRRATDTYYIPCAGGNTTLACLKEIYQETQNPELERIQCLFMPWTSESHTRIAHLIENDVRGDLIFIDKAQAIMDTWWELEKEQQQKISQTALTDYLRQQGYSINQPKISRMRYAVEKLSGIIPDALNAGLGFHQIERIKQLESALYDYLKHRCLDSEACLHLAQDWFFETLAEFDQEDWDIAPIKDSLINRLAEQFRLPVATMRLDIESLLKTGAIADRKPLEGCETAKASMKTDKSESRDSAGSLTEVSVKEIGVATKNKPIAPSLDALRQTLYQCAFFLAQQNQLDHCLLAVATGAGYLVDLPDLPINPRQQSDGSIDRKKQSLLWWFLASLNEQFSQNPQALLEIMPESAKLYHAARRMADGAKQGQLISHYVGVPTIETLGCNLLSRLTQEEYQQLIALIEALRGLKAHSLALGQSSLWSALE